MISKDEEALICDFAETYHIYNYRELPVSLMATLASGLRGDSRIMMSLNKVKYNSMEILTATIVDRLNEIAWYLFGRKGKHPKSIVADMLNYNQQSVTSFNTVEDFENKKKQIIGKEK